ncbi:MAG TPA: hypothetical protein VHM92_14320 [Allosphingosinicella sp.]|nr:hypothetical protein [Allosphingosinicella sp.]
MKSSILLSLALAALPLGGCAASIAAGAVGAAVRAADRPDRAPAVDPGPFARQACSERAAPYGGVHIIDTEYRTPAKLTVWGTVEAQGKRRSFECRYEGQITDFKLREITGS